MAFSHNTVKNSTFGTFGGGVTKMLMYTLVIMAFSHTVVESSAYRTFEHGATTSFDHGATKRV